MRRNRYNLLSLLVVSLFISGLVAGCSSGITLSAAPTNTATQEVTISLPGDVVNTILITDQGKSLKKTQITSSDGNITLSIDQGTALLNNVKQPLQSINALIDTTIPLPPENAQLLGM